MDAIAAMKRVLAELEIDSDPEMDRTAERFIGLLSEFRGEPLAPAMGTCTMTSSGPVLLRDMAFHSLCAHHLVPFFGDISVAYLPGARLAGLGGIARVANHFARRLQLQERLAEDIADELVDQLSPRGVVVRVTARQMCMELRGARTRAAVETWAKRGEASELVVLF